LSFKLFRLKLVKYTSPASRFTFRYSAYWNYQFKHKKLSIYKKSTAGRNDSGRIIFRSRASSVKKNKSINVNYIFRYKKTAILGTFQFVPYRNKLLSLIFFSNGSVNYIITTEFQRLFSYSLWNLKGRVRGFKIKTLGKMMCHFKRLTYVSLIEIYPGRGAQYCRSSGTSSRIIKFDTSLNTALIQLPSKVKKIISYYCVAFLGRVALRSKKYCTSNRAGYWRNFGFKPIVRGVAMNPVDHPHGGRTKSVKYPRTPWGKTTKFK